MNKLKVGDEVEVIKDNENNNGIKKIGDKFIIQLITNAYSSGVDNWIHYKTTTGWGISNRNLKLVKEVDLISNIQIW